MRPPRSSEAGSRRSPPWPGWCSRGSDPAAVRRQTPLAPSSGKGSDRVQIPSVRLATVFLNSPTIGPGAEVPERGRDAVRVRGCPPADLRCPRSALEPASPACGLRASSTPTAEKRRRPRRRGSPSRLRYRSVHALHPEPRGWPACALEIAYGTWRSPRAAPTRRVTGPRAVASTTAVRPVHPQAPRRARASHPRRARASRAPRS